METPTRMSRRQLRVLLDLALLIPALLAATLAGCAKSSQVTGPRGDNAGEHLLAFRTDRSAPGQFDIALYDMDFVGFRSLAGLNSSADERDPAISNDGNLVAFASNRPAGAGGYDVYVYDRLSQTMVSARSLNTAADETQPRFAFDSVRLAFTRSGAGGSRVRLYEPVADSLVALPNLDASPPFDDAAPSPDLHGNRIAFQSNRSGRWHVYVWDRGAAGLLPLTVAVGDSQDVEPSMTLDGRFVAFASNRSGGSGGYDLYLADIGADTLIALPRANTVGDENHPALSSAANTLIFQSRASAAEKWDLWAYTVVDSLRGQPLLLPSATSDDMHPYLRWR